MEFLQGLRAYQVSRHHFLRVLGCSDMMLFNQCILHTLVCLGSALQAFAGTLLVPVQHA